MDIECGWMTKPDGPHGTIISNDQEDQCGFANRIIRMLLCAQASAVLHRMT